MIATRRVLATLSAVTPTATVFGGQARSWTPLASLWVSLSPISTGLITNADQRPVRREQMRAEARDLSLVAPDQRLSIGPRHWRITMVDHGQPQPGLMVLELESDAS
jgi:hypothetical protein